MKKTLRAVLFSIVLLSALFGLRLFPNQDRPGEDAPAALRNPGLVDVLRVIDGDTIEVVMEKGPEKVRMIGIDTPEVLDPRKPVQCFGREASLEARRVLSGIRVRLEDDPSQDEKDKYGRFLAYVFLEDGTNFNKHMIESGFAHEYTYNLPYLYQGEFKQAQSEARAAGRGLWDKAACPE